MVKTQLLSIPDLINRQTDDYTFLQKMNKEKIAILYGGKSTEHEVSIRSARNIAKAIDQNKYELVLLAVAKTGEWLLKSMEELNREDVVMLTENILALCPGSDQNIILLSKNEPLDIDVIFPIIHGTGGEDGSLQGILKTLNIAFVGPGVIGSSLCIDKDIAKKVLRDAKIPSSKFLSYEYYEKDQIKYEVAQHELGLPMYIKPPNLGSSVGISKVTTKREFYEAIELAFKYDKKVLIEENIVGREIECAVLGNATPKASPVGQVVTIGDSHTFYSYDAKYTDANGSVTVIPADIPEDEQDRIRTLAIETYQALQCEGMARVDVFLKENGEILVNEVNTLPGFTDISMYPKLWEAGGISYSDLITILLNLAKERHGYENSLITSV